MEATRDNTKYALKIYNLSILSAVEQQGIHQEIEILKRVESKSIVRLYRQFDDFFEEIPSKVLVMEYMSGGDLFERIASRKTYAESDAREATRQILNAISHCHGLFIVHRDLKPENILLTGNDEDTEIKLGDFGFATCAATNDSLKTQCGTLTYVAPEILLGKRYGSLILIPMKLYSHYSRSFRLSIF